ncbi:carbohydrate binding family 9 domain-containing protein [Arenibacter latericius]|uniref:carbohydrate binding family 9 domain-containing protein n=1 Tax=Arenibacter latericius TaxID=86104 RepID=UPI002934846C|nr:carbohydrate binding family 9 domain-containing protein [Arenibacter latericius]
MRTSYLALCVLLFTQVICYAQDSTKKNPIKKIYTTQAIRDMLPPEVDGNLDEDVWTLVPWEGGFVEQRPDENTEPDHQTKFKIIYDNNFLYVGIRCYDSEPNKIEKRLSRRDGFEGGWIAIFIDSYFDKRTAFGFLVTAAGVKADILESNNGENEDESWNPIWYTKTNIDLEGWSAEMKIPLSQLKFGKAKEQTWGLQLMRRLFREEERSVWQRLPQDTPGFVSEFGLLQGISDLEPQK